MVFDINSPEEATYISGDLMRWAEQYDCHILSIIHENKNSGTARGHLGTEMVNKAEIVLQVANEDGQTVVKPEYCRGDKIEPMAFERDNYGIPHLVSYKQTIQTGESKAKAPNADDLPHDHHLEILYECFKREKIYTYAEIQVELRGACIEKGFTLGVNKVKDFISWYARKNYVISFKDGSKTMYKIHDDYKDFTIKVDF